jgi:integrase
VAEEIVEYNAAAAVPKPRYERAREPHIFIPADVEQIRSKLDTRGAMLVSLLAYSGPRPEEVVRRLAWKDVGERAILYVDTKRHCVRYTPLLAPLADDLREWFLASGRPDGNQPVLPAHDGGLWVTTTGADASGTGSLSARSRGGAPRPRAGAVLHPAPDHGTYGQAS